MAKQARELIPAVAYLRTSSAANVGADKDSERRQREAIQGFARRAGYQIVDEFYDAAVSGADAIDAGAGFAAMLKRIEGNATRAGARRPGPGNSSLGSMTSRRSRPKDKLGLLRRVFLARRTSTRTGRP